MDTVTVQEAVPPALESPDKEQLISAVPAEMAVTVPSAATEATFGLELVKVREEPAAGASMGLPSMEAVRTADSPAFRESEVLLKVMSLTAAG